MQNNGSVEVGQPDDAMGGDTSQGVTLTIVVKGDSITCNGEPCDIGEAMKQVIEAYESQESPDGDEANFQAGLGNRPGPISRPDDMNSDGSGY